MAKKSVKTVRTKVYQFEKLSEDAKKKVIQAFNDVNVDYDWWDSTYEFFHGICETIGITVDLKKTYFRGFYIQGQGASFTADIDLQKLITGINNKAWSEKFPKLEFNPSPCKVDRRVLKLIHSGVIDFTVCAVANDRSYSTKAEIYSNYTCNECTNYNNIDKELYFIEEWINDIFSDLDALLFKSLESEYEWRTSKEQIIETIEANEYWFTEDGKHFPTIIHIH